jgi:hypothetical protein
MDGSRPVSDTEDHGASLLWPELIVAIGGIAAAVFVIVLWIVSRR